MPVQVGFCDQCREVECEDEAACDGHGHRVFVTTKSDQSRFAAVIDDPTCEGDR